MSVKLSSLVVGVCSLLVLAPQAWAGKGASTVAFSPVCVTRAGAALFFAEQTEDCGGPARHCRASRWAYAALKAGAWEIEPLGEATNDAAADPENNAQAGKQLFKAPAAHVCASFLRAPVLREPNLPDSDVFFQYSIERGVLVLHWGELKATVPGDVRLARAGWAQAGLRAESKPLDAGYTLLETRAGKQAAALVVPTVELTVASELLLGFPEPAKESNDLGFMVLQVSEAKLRALQARLLHDDARRLLEKEADLLADARAAGLLDAALQLSPENAEVRLDYARILARQGEAAQSVRELERIKTTRGLRTKIDSDKAFIAVKVKEPFSKFLESLPK